MAKKTIKPKKNEALNEIHVYLESDLYKKIKTEADEQRRSLTSQACWILSKHYA